MEGDAHFEVETDVFLTNDKKHLKEFILALEILPEVWDSSNLNRYNKAKRAKAYKQLLEIYKKIKPYATLKDVNTKVNSLKSNYRKEYKKITDLKRSNTSEDVNIPTSWVFKMLKFLDKNENSTDMDTSDSEVSTSKYKVKEEHTDPLLSSLDETGPPPKKVKKNMPAASQNDHPEKKVCNCSSHQPVTNQPPTVSFPNIHPAALYWTQKLSALKPTQRVLAEKAINDVLFEAELGTLKANSVQINTGYEGLNESPSKDNT